MKSFSPKQAARNFDYPEKTKGSEIAAQVRSDANNVSEDERAALFDLGKELIYGGIQ